MPAIHEFGGLRSKTVVEVTVRWSWARVKMQLSFAVFELHLSRQSSEREMDEWRLWLWSRRDLSD